eukprot:UN25948
MFSQMENLELKTRKNWDIIREKALARDISDCPICMCTLDKKPCILLSCTHIFHAVCINSFENFKKKMFNHECPLCRTVYEKTEL